MDKKWHEYVAFMAFALCAVAYSVYLVLLVPDLQTATAAAWVQAIGSIGAILATGGAAVYQIKKGREHTENLREEKRTQFLLAAALAADEALKWMNIYLNTIRQEGEMSDEMKRIGAALIGRSLQNIDAIPIWELNNADAHILVKVRRMLNSVLSVLNADSSGADRRGLGIIVLLDRLYKSIERESEYLRQRYQKLTDIDLASL